MTAKELWASYQHYTRDFTEHARTLGVGAAGICWLFKTEKLTFPVLIYFALLAVVLYFLADVCHSLFAALTVRMFTRNEEKKQWEETGKVDENTEINTPVWVDAPATVFFCAKALCLLLSFSFIGAELIKRLLLP